MLSMVYHPNSSRIPFGMLAFALVIQLTIAMHGGKEQASSGQLDIAAAGTGTSATGAAGDDEEHGPPRFLDGVKKGLRRFGYGAKEAFIGVLSDKFPIIDGYEELNSVKLLQWEDKKAKKRIGDECRAEIKEKDYFLFDWQQCHLVAAVVESGKKQQQQFLTLEVQYGYKVKVGQREEARTRVFSYPLWNTHLFPAKSVKRWLEGKGLFWLDHNCHPEKLFKELDGLAKEKEQKKLSQALYPFKEKGLCLAKPHVPVRPLGGVI